MTETKKRTKKHDSNNNNVDQQIKLLKQDCDEPHLLHGKACQELPSWFDEEKFRRGQKFFQENYYALFVSKLCGLLVILCAPRTLRILIMTQRSSKPNTAFKRYFSTLSHMLLWYNGDVRDKGSWAYRSLNEVYMKHMAANRRGINEKAGSVNQSSLAITQFGFMGFGLLMPEKLGIKIKDPKDVEGFVHFWRAIGYLIGVDDQFNICKDSVEETKQICQRILEEILWPHLKNPSKEFIHMTTALLQGMWVMVPFLNVEAFMNFTYDLAGLPTSKFTNWFSAFIYNMQRLVHQTILNSYYFGGIARFWFNFQMWIAVVITSKFPLFAYFSWGIPITSKSES